MNMEKHEMPTRLSDVEETVISEVEPTFERLTKREYFAALGTDLKMKLLILGGTVFRFPG